MHAGSFYGDGSNLTGILTNPLNVDLTINSAGDAASPILRLNNSSSNTFNHALEAINANLTAGETELLLFGKATNTRNSGFIGFNWNADNSDTNYVTIGHWGYNHLLKIFPTGNATFAGSVNVNTNGLINFEQNPDVDTGTEVVAQVTKATYTAAFFDFVIKKGTNVRAGVVYACHDGSTGIEYAETSTVDLGDTTDVTLSVDLGSSTMRLLATTTSNDWSVKSLIRAI